LDAQQIVRILFESSDVIAVIEAVSSHPHTVCLHSVGALRTEYWPASRRPLPPQPLHPYLMSLNFWVSNCSTTIPQTFYIMLESVKEVRRPWWPLRWCSQRIS